MEEGATLQVRKSLEELKGFCDFFGDRSEKGRIVVEFLEQNPDKVVRNGVNLIDTLSYLTMMPNTPEGRVVAATYVDSLFANLKDDVGEGEIERLRTDLYK